MAKVLNLDEMLQILIDGRHDAASTYKTMLEAIGTLMAIYVGEMCKCAFGNATYQGIHFAGTCACFGPKSENDPVPAALEQYDRSADWTRDFEDYHEPDPVENFRSA